MFQACTPSSDRTSSPSYQLPAEDDHVARIGGHRHIHRFVSEEGVRRIRQIDEFYRLDARTTGVPVLSGDAGEEDCSCRPWLTWLPGGADRGCRGNLRLESLFPTTRVR